MMRDELYINGIKVELSGDTGIVLNFAAGDPSDMTAIASGSSYTVSLPLTAHNIQTFGFINLPGSTSDIPNREHSARLVRGGIPIFEDGKATVSGVGKTIDVLLTWNRSDVLVSLSRAKMRDMAITEMMRLDPDNFELSQTDNLKWVWNTGYVVNTRYDVRGFRPAVKVSWLLGKLLPDFSIRADYWSFIQRMWIMLPTMLGNSSILSKIGYTINGSYNYNASADKKPDILSGVGSTYLPVTGGYNLFFPQDNSRTEYSYLFTPKRGSYRFLGSINATMTSNSTATFKIIKNREIIVDRDGAETEEYDTLYESTLTGSLVNFDKTFVLDEGDKIGIIIVYATAASNTVTLNLTVSYDVLTADNTDTAYLLDYPIRENLPDITMLDFVKGVFGTMGLMTEHTIDGLHMFTADDVILSTDRKDISGMLVDEKETKLAFSRGLTKYNTLGYKDKTDYITFPADTYEKTEHAVVTLPFVLKDTVMFKYDGSQFKAEDNKEIRLLLLDGTKSVFVSTRPTGGSRFAGYRTVSLSAFTTAGLAFETLADTYWRGYIGAFSVAPRIVTKRALLTPDFVQSLSFSKAVYDGQNYYMLLRVSDYDKNGLATLEMALIDGIDLSAANLTNVILTGVNEVLLFDGTTPALYEPPAGGTGSVSGKMIRELEEFTGDITEDMYMPIDMGSGPARKRKLSGVSHTHANKAFLDVINQGLSTGSSVLFKEVFATGPIVAGALNGTPPEDLPVATGLLYGVVKLDDITIKLDPVTGKIYSVATGGTSVSWGTEVAGQSIQLNVASVLKTLALASHTHSNYLTAITKAMVEAVLTGTITSHQHNYMPLSGGNFTNPITVLGHTVWNAGNDGAGSGLDADLLDGQHGSFYFNRNTQFNANNVDYNAVNYEIGHGVTTQPIHLPNYTGAVNAPFSSYGQMVHFDGNSFFPFRIAFDYSGRMFFQGAGYKPNGPYNYSNGTQWLEFFHSGNSNKKTVDWNAKNLYAEGVYSDGPVVAGALNGTPPDDLPVATSSLFGVIKIGLSLYNNAGVVNVLGRHYTATNVYTDGAVRDITAEIPIGTGSLLNTEAMSLQLPFLPSNTTKTVTGNILINPTTWAGTGLNVTFLNNGTNYVAFITNYSGSTITKDGIKITVMAKQSV